MEGFAALLILLGIGFFVSGPVAVVMAIVLFNKLGSIHRRLNKLEGKPEYTPYPSVPAGFVPPVPKPAAPPAAVPAAAPVKAQVPSQPVEPQRPPQPVLRPIPAEPVRTIQATPVPPLTPLSEAAAAIKTYPPLKPKPAVKGGLELKLGTTVALIVGVVTVIVGVAFFLKYVYENMVFGEVTRVCMVAAGGLIGIVIGEVLRRRDYEIVAKGIAALGFALLYAAVFSGSRVYHLFSTEWAFGLSIVVTAAAMAYAVTLNEILIAFLALLGGYLSPVIISTGQNLPIPLFSYVFVLSGGAMGCAMFRRWRAVNWIAMVGTYLLYTAWFEKFYTAEQLRIGLFWMGVFGGMYLILPILNGLVKKVIARSEDVSLVVVNSIAVYYYLWRMLYDGARQDLALASAVLGIAHITVVFIILWRCRDDKNLQAAMGVLGSAFITAAIPMYFNTLQPTLIGWSIEAVVLTFVAVRYHSRWTQVMSILVTAIASAGLFYHLPLHTSADFRLIVNGPFGTWVWVSLAVILCHALWRFMQPQADEEGTLLAQVYFVWGRLLLATGLALEWYAHCDWHIEYLKQDQAYFLMGMMVLAAILLVGFLTRPVCPKGDLVRMVGVMVAVIGSVFVAMAMTGVYYKQFTLFLNVPFVIAVVFVGSVYYGVWQIKRTADKDALQLQLPGALVTMGLVLVLVLLSEQIYMYWYCRNQYGQSISNWQSIAFLYMFILWAVSGIMMLFLGIRFQKPVLKALAVITSGLSIVGVFIQLPLHTSGDFQFVFNQPFITWVSVAAALLIGHGLWRFMPVSKDFHADVSQLYYAAGLFLLALGCALEWHAHCRWQIEPHSVGESNFMLGIMVLCGLLVLSFLAKPLPPQGILARVLGALAALGGAFWTALAMNEVYTDGFMIFANVPFLGAVFFVASVLAGAWFVKRDGNRKEGQFRLAAALVLGALVLIWVLLGEQIHQYFWCRNHFVQTIDNWRFLSRMYISVTWAVYAAVLIVLGFVFRAAGIRYLSLLIFAVLLGKINLDIWHLGTEYRIATFLTTGLILVGVSLLYQFLKNKGFFDTIDKQLSNAES